MPVLELLAPYAPLVVAPLALAQCERLPKPWLTMVVPLLLPVLSFAPEQGLRAALFCLPYLVLTLYLAWFGLQRIGHRGWSPLWTSIMDVAFVYLALGAAFLVASRAGLTARGFPDAVVLMTAVHFHYAGFAACVFAGLTGRALGSRAESSLYRSMAWAIVAGTPLMVLGTALTRWLEIVAGLLLAAGVTAMSAFAMTAARGRLASLGFSITAAATVVAMAIAGMYAFTQVAGAYWLPIPQMALAHGLANAFGFATIGLATHWWNSRS